MEKTLKVYVYEEGEPPVFHFGPCKHTYAIEGYFIQAMEITPFRTSDPNQAHLFFLPISVTMLTHVVFIRESHSWTEMMKTAFDYVNVIAHKYPFWNRSLGADHFILACHDWVCIYLLPHFYICKLNIIYVEKTKGFGPKRDVSIPEIHLPRGTTEGLLGGPSPSERSVLVFYSGGLHGPIRPILMQHWENKSDEDVQIHSYLPKVSYYGMMLKSKYCILPQRLRSGKSQNGGGALHGLCSGAHKKRATSFPSATCCNWKKFCGDYSGEGYSGPEENLDGDFAEAVFEVAE
nr:probable glycosyltransferase At5g03795 [Ipomoea batatas]